MSQVARQSSNGVLWLGLFLLLLSGLLVIYIPKLRDAQRLRHEKYTLDQQLQEQEREYRHLLARQQALRNDRRAVEQAAREKLKLAKPGETIFRFEPENSSGSRGNP